MDYKKIYNDIIKNRVVNKINKEICYCELHHIIPKSMGGSNRKENLVYLTAREHFIAHWLLSKIHKTRGMYLALLRMRSGNRGAQKENTYINSKGYEYAKKQYINSMKGYKHSEATKQKIRDGNIGRKHSDESKIKMSLAKLGIPLTESHKDKIIEKTRGLKRSEETKARISEAKKKIVGEAHNRYGTTQEVVECPHCGKTGGKNGMVQWHFDRCKYKIT